MLTECSGHFDTHHVRHHRLYVPRSQKSHSLQDLSKFTSHTPFLFTSHLHPACLYEPASHRHAAQSCRPPLSPSPSQTEWEKFTLAFSFFSWVFCEAVVMVMGHKDSSGSQCTHEWEEHWVCECECGCVFVCPAWCLKMRLRDDLPLISWMWCAFYCLLNRGFVYSALLRVLIKSWYFLSRAIHDILTVDQIKIQSSMQNGFSQ